MTKTIRRHVREGDGAGFTLVELLVVVLILGILMVVAIPTFLNLVGGAKTNGAESDLSVAAQDEAGYLSANGNFDPLSTTPATATTDNVAAMIKADPGINWVATTPGTPGSKSVAVDVTSNSVPPPTVYLEEAGSDGNFYWAEDLNGLLSYAVTSVKTPAIGYAAVGDFGLSWKTLPTRDPAGS